MRTKAVVTSLCVIFLASCTTSHKDHVGVVDPAGIYVLVLVDGAQVPTTSRHGNHEIEIQSGTFTINPDGTCSSEVIFGPPAGKMQTRVIHATYTREGAELDMKWEGAGRTKGVLEGDSFTMNNEGMIFKYQRKPQVD